MKQIKASERTWPTMRVRGAPKWGKATRVEDAVLTRLDPSETEYQYLPPEPTPLPEPELPQRAFGTSLSPHLTQAVRREPVKPDYSFLNRLGKQVESAIRSYVPWERWHSDPTRSCPRGRETPEGLYLYEHELPALGLPTDIHCWLVANKKCWNFDLMSKRRKMTLATLRRAVLEDVQAQQNELQRGHHAPLSIPATDSRILKQRR
jgi:hypothetical protein